MWEIFVVILVGNKEGLKERCRMEWKKMSSNDIKKGRFVVFEVE